jgi:predicted permease
VISLAIEVLSILAPSAALALIGLIWFHRGPEYPIQFVTTLVINVGMPALLFHTLATSTIELFSLGRMALGTLVVHILMVSVFIAVLKSSKKDWRLCVPLTVGNTGNLGLPVCFLAFGEVGLAYAMVFFSVQCLLLFSLGEAVYAGRANFKNTLRSPILIAILAGMAFRFSGATLPDPVFDTLKLLGQFVIPIMLITLGVSLAGMRAKLLSNALIWSSIRLAVALLVAFSVSALLGLTGIERGVLIIETIVPVAVFNFLLLIKHNRDPAEVTSLILVTHLSAIIYLPIVLGLLLME